VLASGVDHLYSWHVEINTDPLTELHLRERRFPLPAAEAEPRPGVDVNENAALLECLDGEPWNQRQ